MTLTRASRPTVLIVARAAELRSELGEAIGAIADWREAADAVGALDVLRREPADLCLLELDGGGGGLRLAELIHRTWPSAQIVLLAHAPNDVDLLRAVRAGARGYVPVTVGRSRLPHIVEAVLRGEPAVPRALVGPLVDACRSPGSRHVRGRDRRIVDLTRREAEVLDLIREGVPTRAIADRLGISVVTVRRHRASLLAKLGVHSAEELRTSAGAGQPGQPPVVVAELAGHVPATT